VVTVMPPTDGLTGSLGAKANLDGNRTARRTLRAYGKAPAAPFQSAVSMSLADSSD